MKNHKKMIGKRVLLLTNQEKDIEINVEKVTAAMIYGKDENGVDRKIYIKNISDYVIFERN